ncbi:MAG: 3-methyl-2-oxobutanoate hydroxymethyltransferase [Mariprofundales bacterium]|nr:3-methyl-2-oxobutanoate hydroxymethyltransferase [Mariprofundales bacterium]
MVKHFTAANLRQCKEAGEKLCWLTAYDAPSAQIAEAAGVDVLLVGDSLGMTLLGFDSTIHVTLEMMAHHAAAVVRGRQRAWVVVDLPFGSYQGSPEQAFASAVTLLQQTGCDAVKLEGGAAMVETVRFLSARGLAVVAHLGLLPQSIKQLGDYRRQATDGATATRLLDDAEALAGAGALALVLESIPHDLAAAVTARIAIPTIGIGAGTGCDGQVLVWHDLLGLSLRNPPFAPQFSDLRSQAEAAIGRWCGAVRQGEFPPVS